MYANSTYWSSCNFWTLSQISWPFEWYIFITRCNLTKSLKSTAFFATCSWLIIALEGVRSESSDWGIQKSKLYHEYIEVMLYFNGKWKLENGNLKMERTMIKTRNVCYPSLKHLRSICHVHQRPAFIHELPKEHPSTLYECLVVANLHELTLPDRDWLTSMYCNVLFTVSISNYL